MNPMQVRAKEEPVDFISIRVREDNLMYLFFTDTIAFSVDSFSPKTIAHALSCSFDKQNYTEKEIMELECGARRRELKCVLTTHKHFDHAGGNEELMRMFPGAMLVDSCAVEDGQVLSLLPFSITFLKTPCHTLDSVCYYVARGSRRYLLTGDYLFRLGCGRFFEGNAAQFLRSLVRLCGAVDDDTLMLYGHDYSSTNRRFAEQFYPVEDCDGFFLTFGQEKRFNPFLNSRRALGGDLSEEDAVDTLRRMKDRF